MLKNIHVFFFLKENQFAMHTVWQGVRGRDLRYACTCVPTIDSLTDYHYLTEKNGRAYQDCNKNSSMVCICVGTHVCGNPFFSTIFFLDPIKCIWMEASLE